MVSFMGRRSAEWGRRCSGGAQGQKEFLSFCQVAQYNMPRGPAKLLLEYRLFNLRNCSGHCSEGATGALLIEFSCI